ncbi:MAG: glycoside hydrolase family 43 protein [Treponema sp.]|nr:glycoside hydrolase family 43 protein [Treponema sp.]
MKKNISRIIVKGILLLSIIALLSCADKKSSAKSDAKAGKDVDLAVYKKYSRPNNGNQNEWECLNCHDPKLFQDDDGTYYVYSTDAAIGNKGERGLQIRKSKDLVHWESLSKSMIQGNWDQDWLDWSSFNEVTASSWAPTVIKQKGLYYLLHGICVGASDGSHHNASIAFAISTSPEGPFYPAQDAASKDPKIAKILSDLGVEYKQSVFVRYAYVDRSEDPFEEESITKYSSYNTGSYDTISRQELDYPSWSGGFGAIDPEFVFDVATGSLMTYKIGGNDCYALTYGSWKGGIALVYLDALSLKPVDKKGRELDVPADNLEDAFGIIIAGGNGAAYEGAQLIYNSDTDYYYVFVSMGDLQWEYRIGLGRSKEIEGPYLDTSGNPMVLEMGKAEQYHSYGGKILPAVELEGEYSFRSQGGQSILRTADGKIMLACHSRTNFTPEYYFFLQLHQMFFNKDGWPILNQNEYYNDYEGLDEGLRPLSVEEIAGTYDVILTQRSSETKPVKFFGNASGRIAHIADALPATSQEIILSGGKSGGSIKGAYRGKWTLMQDGYTIEMDIKNIGIFRGYVFQAVDWAKKSTSASRKTISFTLLDSEKSGEYFWGNRKNR